MLMLTKLEDSRPVVWSEISEGGRMIGKRGWKESRRMGKRVVRSCGVLRSRCEDFSFYLEEKLETTGHSRSVSILFEFDCYF